MNIGDRVEITGGKRVGSHGEVASIGKKTLTIKLDSGDRCLLAPALLTPETEYQRRKTGRKVPCTGEAHSNPYIDHCMRCAPEWGIVDEYEPALSLEAVERIVASGLAVAAFDVSTEALAALRLSKTIEMVGVEHRKPYGSTSYFVFRAAAT